MGGATRSTYGARVVPPPSPPAPGTRRRIEERGGGSPAALACLLAGRSRRAGRAKAPCLTAAAAHWAVHHFRVLEILDEQTFLCASAKHSFETKLLSCNYELFWDIFDVNRLPQSFVEDVLLL